MYGWTNGLKFDFTPGNMDKFLQSRTGSLLIRLNFWEVLKFPYLMNKWTLWQSLQKNSCLQLFLPLMIQEEVLLEDIPKNLSTFYHWIVKLDIIQHPNIEGPLKVSCMTIPFQGLFSYSMFVFHHLPLFLSSNYFT